MQISSSDDSDSFTADYDNNTTQNDETSDTEDDEDDLALQGTKREFTISLELWKVFRRKIHSTRIVTEWMPHLFVRTTTDEIGGGQMLQMDYRDDIGTLLKARAWPASERLVSLQHDERQGISFECTNAKDCGKVTVYNTHGYKMDGRYWTRIILGIKANYDYEFSKSNESIPRCVRQLGFTTLEEMAHFYRADLLSTLAYFCRTRKKKLNVKGYISHLFLAEPGDPDESVFVAPVERSKLEGVTLIRIDRNDYSLKTGKRVGYEPAGKAFEVVAEGGRLHNIDDDALVG